MFIAKNGLVSRFIEYRYDVKGAPTTLPLTAGCWTDLPVVQI